LYYKRITRAITGRELHTSWGRFEEGTKSFRIKGYRKGRPKGEKGRRKTRPEEARSSENGGGSRPFPRAIFGKRRPHQGGLGAEGRLGPKKWRSANS